MPNYSYFYTKAIVGDDGNVKLHKFQNGNAALHGFPTDDVWSTSGRYRLASRILRGGLSGSGDVFHPANAIFKILYQRPMTPGVIFNTFGPLPDLTDVHV